MYSFFAGEKLLTTEGPMTVETLHAILEDVLDEPVPALSESTTANEVAGWDSLNHVRLLVHIERAYRISFPTDSVERLENVGKLVALVNRLISEQPRR
jgi:acyl carrier protein